MAMTVACTVFHEKNWLYKKEPNTIANKNLCSLGFSVVYNLVQPCYLAISSVIDRSPVLSITIRQL